MPYYEDDELTEQSLKQIPEQTTWQSPENYVVPSRAMGPYSVLPVMSSETGDTPSNAPDDAAASPTRSLTYEDYRKRIIPAVKDVYRVTQGLAQEFGAPDGFWETLEDRLSTGGRRGREAYRAAREVRQALLGQALAPRHTVEELMTIPGAIENFGGNFSSDQFIQTPIFALKDPFMPRAYIHGTDKIIPAAELKPFQVANMNYYLEHGFGVPTSVRQKEAELAYHTTSAEAAKKQAERGREVPGNVQLAHEMEDALINDFTAKTGIPKEEIPPSILLKFRQQAATTLLAEPRPNTVWEKRAVAEAEAVAATAVDRANADLELAKAQKSKLDAEIKEIGSKSAREQLLLPFEIAYKAKEINNLESLIETRNQEQIDGVTHWKNRFDLATDRNNIMEEQIQLARQRGDVSAFLAVGEQRLRMFKEFLTLYSNESNIKNRPEALEFINKFAESAFIPYRVSTESHLFGNKIVITTTGGKPVMEIPFSSEKNEKQYRDVSPDTDLGKWLKNNSEK